MADRHSRLFAFITAIYTLVFVLSLLLFSETVRSQNGPRRIPAEIVPARFRGAIIARRVRHFPQRLIALTFDDGPDEQITPRILDSLAAHKAHATFFVLGRQARLHPDHLRRMVAGGHCIGNHSYDHPAHVTALQAQRELTQTEAIIRQVTGQTPSLFRPPYGITRNSLTHAAQSRGYTVVTWTISSADTRPIGPNIIADNIIHTPSPGDIALMHDGPGHTATAAAVPLILDQLSRAGYRFVTLPELLRAWDRWRKSHG